jgi:hypothetical protein
VRWYFHNDVHCLLRLPRHARPLDYELRLAAPRNRAVRDHPREISHKRDTKDIEELLLSVRIQRQQRVGVLSEVVGACYAAVDVELCFALV